MTRFESRLATSSDTAALYDLLNEYVIEEDFGEEFTNSQEKFREHFNKGLFRALVTEVLDDKDEREIIGCLFLSLSYFYVSGRVYFAHCCHIKPAYRDHGLERELIKQAKKVASDEGIHFILMTINGNDVTYKSVMEDENGMNMTTMPKGALDYWFMSNPSMIPEMKYDDFVIHEATDKDLSGVHPLLQKLIELEDIGEYQAITQEEFERVGRHENSPFGAIVLEHQIDNQNNDIGLRHEIVGCVLYTKMYHALKGRTYFIQGLYVLPHIKGKGLGKALVRALQKACKDRHGDGFIFMILHDNVVSESLFRSLQGADMTKSKHNIQPYFFQI